MNRRSTRRQLEGLAGQQEEMRRLLDALTQALVARDPGGVISANAYDGLRKSVNFAASSRRAHVRQLVQIMDAIDNGATVETLRRKCEQWCLEAGLERVDEPRPDQPTWFRVVEGEGPDLEILTPAWVDTQTDTLAQAGTARASAAPEPGPEPKADAQEPTPEPKAQEPEPDEQDDAEEAPSGEDPAATADDSPATSEPQAEADA